MDYDTGVALSTRFQTRGHRATRTGQSQAGTGQMDSTSDEKQVKVCPIRIGRNAHLLV